MTQDPPNNDASTRAIHAGRPSSYWLRSILPPIVHSTTFRFASVAELRAHRTGEAGFPEYARYGNPTVDAVQDRLAGICGADAALLTASGMAAQALCVLALCPAGSRIVVTPDHYRGTTALLSSLAPRFGYEVVAAASERASDVALAAGDGATLVFTEFPTNPHLRIPELPAIARVAHDARALLVVDATLTNPLLTRPLDLGADLVLYSATKYLGGHNDLLAGAIVGSSGTIDVLRELQGVIGANCAPSEAALLERGLKTLDVRFRRQTESARVLCERLAAHPAVAEVFYPASEGTQTELLPADARGGLLSFRPVGASTPLPGCSTIWN